MKVLVIDDSDITLELVATVLRAANVEVETLRGPFGSAVSIASGDPDVILIDVTMPGLAGTNLVRLLRNCTSKPLIVYSDRSEEELSELARACEADGHIPKSASTTRLVATLRAAVSPKIM